MVFLKKHDKKLFISLAILLTVTGLSLRLICCFWGYPMRLHTDEPVITDNTIKWLRGEEWPRNAYDWPGNFVIKCNALIFTVFSRLAYHLPAAEAFTGRTRIFHIISRFFTTFFGTALIPLCGILTGKMLSGLPKVWKRLGVLLSMTGICFSCMFIRHSAYATTDIVLSFFTVLFAYVGSLYIEKDQKRYLYLCMILIGVGITVKYPAAILCIPLAGMVILRFKKPAQILKYGLISIFVIISVMFIISPELFINHKMVITALANDSRSTHMGHDGLGFFGNFGYYLKTIFSEAGLISAFPFTAGIFYMLTSGRKKVFPLIVFSVFMTCISILALHWERWALPFFTGFYILIAVGFAAILYGSLRYLRTKKVFLFPVCVAVGSFIILYCVNLSLEGASVARFSLLPDSRTISRADLTKAGITKDNSLLGSYTPYRPLATIGSRLDYFYFADQDIKVKIENAVKKYFIQSDHFVKIYFAEPEKYSEELAKYNRINEQYEMVYKLSCDGNYQPVGGILENIGQSIKYLKGNQTCTGNDITVWDLAPVTVRLQTAAGSYLVPVSEAEGEILHLSDQAEDWVLYEGGTSSRYSILSAKEGFAAEPDPDLDGEGIPRLAAPVDDPALQWQIAEEDGWTYLLFGGQMALTYTDQGTVTVAPFERTEQQKWKLLYL